MRNLLATDFMRLWKSKAFWGCFAAGIFMCLATTLGDYHYLQVYQDPKPLDEVFFNNIPLMGLLSAAFVSLFLGADFSYGTIRNKISAGYKREQIYLSGWLVCISGILIILVAMLGGTALIGIPLFGMFERKPQEVFLLTAVCFLVIAAFTGLFVMVVMAVHERAVSAVLCLALFLLMTFPSSLLESRLHEEKIQYSYAAVDENGVPTLVEEGPNPRYIGGIKRQILLVIHNVNLPGQTSQISNLDFLTNPAEMMLCSAGVLLVTTGIGILIFKRKDMK